MKKLAVLLLCLGLLLAGCSSSKEDDNGWKPELVSDDFAPYVERAVEILEQYLDSDISADYASLRLEALGDEVEALDIDYGDILGGKSKYCEADWMIAMDIRILSIGGISTYAEPEFYENHIDVFNFHLGEKISGKKFAPGKHISEEDALSKKLVDSAIPVSSAYDGLNASPEITLSFEYLDGVNVEELDAYVQKVIRAADREDVLLEEITVVYTCCDQIVFEIIIDLSDNPVNGALYPYKYPFIPAEIEPLATFDSLADLPDVLQIAQDYFGRD